jgi:signal transduction histidine kinase
VGTRRRDRWGAGRTLPLEAYFEGKPPSSVVALAVVFVVCIGVADRLTGRGATLAPFYLMPVLLVSWNVERIWGLAIAGLAAVAAQLADVEPESVLVPSWNAIVWFATLVFFVWLLSMLKEAVSRQHLRLAREAELADGLREQNEVKDTLLHAVSHDLKGPLAGILGAVQTIRRAGQLHLTETEMNDLYEVIDQSARKGNRLVDDLLDLDRIERGQLQPERESTDVGELARRLAREAPGLAGHPIRVEADDGLVEVDAVKAERIVDNLLGNAGKHTPLGTPIRVEVHTRANGVVLVVEDEGPGVPDDMKDAVFEPFRQGEDARGGVGIGLSLVRRFAELHGGTAHVEDRPGGGARFVVTLPGAVHTSQDADALHAV